ncbi:tetratricopeptide repeat protein [Massilia sp. TN1-12]|uniref:O-linked N-acetylglucosamine transferase, SPINDLY family protein n=1 Tax=Massilia paldalensis TaxID=3377675 RepID=UPI0038505DB2
MNSIVVPRHVDEVEPHRRAVRLNPRDANAHALLGIALLRQRELAEGVACLRRALELNPKAKDLRALLAAALFDAGDFEAAADNYRQALRFQDTADLHQGLADALRHLGRAAEGETNARRAVALAPDNTAALLTLSAALNAQDKTDEVVAILERVLQLEPDNVDVRYDLGHVLLRAARYADALPFLQEVVQRRPDHALALRHAGTCLRAARRWDEALSCFERALVLAPDNADLLVEVGVTQKAAGDLPGSIATMNQARSIEPDNILAIRGLIYSQFALGAWQEAAAMARAAMAIEPTPDSHSMLLFILSHYCQDADELTREHFAYGERWETPLLALRQPHPNTPDPQRRLRVGLVSADLYHHAVTRFVAPVFESLQHSTQLELYVYYNHTIEDEITQALRSQAAAWRSIAGVDDDAAERMIRDDGIDILIDLSGHSAMNRLPLFARKPAPVQATWIGYAGTTGVKAVDYILCDRFLAPNGRYDDQFSEKVVSLPLGAPFLPASNAPDVNELPALRNGYITFGSFHRASKLSREVIAYWAGLLHAIPDAKMLLGGLETGVDDVLFDWFEEAGIARDRLIGRPRVSVVDYLRQHHEVDVCLSPFPYSGSTTIGHALWMGVPTLATVGATNPSHAAASFMAHLGLSTFITEDRDTYIKLGVFLAQNLPALAAMRASMRERFTNSVLGYPDVCAAGLELGLRKMWQRWCAGEAPAPLRVDLAELVPQDEA